MNITDLVLLVVILGPTQVHVAPQNLAKHRRLGATPSGPSPLRRRVLRGRRQGPPELERDQRRLSAGVGRARGGLGRVGRDQAAVVAVAVAEDLREPADGGRGLVGHRRRGLGGGGGGGPFGLVGEEEGSAFGGEVAPRLHCWSPLKLC